MKIMNFTKIFTSTNLIGFIIGYTVSHLIGHLIWDGLEPNNVFTSIQPSSNRIHNKLYNRASNSVYMGI